MKINLDIDGVKISIEGELGDLFKMMDRINGLMAQVKALCEAFHK